MTGFGCLIGAAFTGWFVVFVFRTLFGIGGFRGLARSGLPARGILLKVNSLATMQPGSNPPVERRQVVIDVEVPGQAPYVVTTQAFIPTNLRNDVMPGATVELRVDKKDPSAIAIVGPGSGFAVTGLVTAPPQGTP